MSEIAYPIRQEDAAIFSFVSEGPKGRVVKVVRFDPIGEGFFNLSFGDQKGDTLGFDDQIVTSNSDRNKVLATVVETIIIFMAENPEANLYFKGSNELRTKLYQRIIKNHRHEFGDNFWIFGGKGDALIELFDPSQEYDYFVLTKKQQP